ncbi:hypothetical protein PILCRDRAFT_3754 [Piloderma croceum F 1598]|uniref:Ubiquitin-like protease family profile domain-containing protein n=1 Tax=Piloderma croceum (strain F 1598) TaxID=765440 RepID=A0A0C3G8I5_PILCF|nr:hypothetical protein PILCRDRAFT_3754 [Piloderma croceum F 1598]
MLTKDASDSDEVWLDPQFLEFHFKWDNHGSGWESFTQMLNQLASTLNRPYVVILGNGEYEFNEISCLFNDWHERNWVNFPESATSLLSLSYQSPFHSLMIMSEEQPTLAGILFLQRKGTHNAHAVLNEHQFRPGYVVTHDFMAHEVPQDDGNEQTDMRWADYVAHFLNKTRPKVMPQIKYFQPADDIHHYSKENDTTNTHIFGVVFLALCLILGMPLSSCLPSPAHVRKILSRMLQEYQGKDTGGLTRTTILELLQPLNSHITSRLAYASKTLLWTPFFNEQHTTVDPFSSSPNSYATALSHLSSSPLQSLMPTIMDIGSQSLASTSLSQHFLQAENVNNHPVDGSESGMIDNIDPLMSPEMVLYTCMKAPIDKKLLDEVDAVMRLSGGLEKIYFNIPKTLRHAAVEMTRDDFRRLQPKAWFNDEIMNAYISLLDAHTPDDIMFLSSFFIAQLNSGGYHKVSGQPKQGLLTGKATLLLLPISEPVVRQQDDQGSHWTLGVLYCHSRQAVYYDSYKPSLGFVIFEKLTREYLAGRAKTEGVPQNDLSAWKFLHDTKIPLQDNGYDCGAFLCTKMLDITLQLHRGAVYVPEYNIPTQTNPIVDSPAIEAPSVSLTQEDIDAVQTLLSLATPERAVHFDHEVQVQEFRQTIRASGTRNGSHYYEDLDGGSEQ